MIKIDLRRRTGESWRSQASNAEAWLSWDRAWRRKLGWRAGLAFWSQTNTPGSRVLLSRHWPHRLCWSWSIWVGLMRPEFDGPRRFLFILRRPYRQFDVRLWWVKVNYHWQDSAWMGALGPAYADAPKLYWKHHLENAEPAGTA